MSVDPQHYRVVTRGKALALVAVIAVAAALLLWYALDWLDVVAERTLELVQSSPRRGAAELATQLRIIGIVNGLVLCALAAYLGRFAYRGMKTASMPPVGSVVVEHRKILTGPGAVRAGRWLLGLAAVLAVLALGVGIAAWQVAARLEEIPGPTERLEDRVLASGPHDGGIIGHDEIRL